MAELKKNDHEAHKMRLNKAATIAKQVFIHGRISHNLEIEDMSSPESHIHPYTNYYLM